MTTTGPPKSRCANCGTDMSDEFCPHCGQSSADVKRNFIPLLNDTLDGLFQWDGRLVTTVREVVSRPGQVARDYMEGRRARYTPPVRLYLIASLIFFIGIALSGVRIVAIDAEVIEQGPSITIELLQGGTPSPPLDISDEEIEEFYANSEDIGISRALSELAMEAALNPETVENRITALASQGQILMVFFFALFNFLLHPRRKLIEHLVYALYFHAAILPLLMVLVAGTAQIPENFFQLASGEPRNIWIAVTIGAVSYFGFSALIWLHDRGFYRSSWWGAALRSQALIILYLFATAFLAFGLVAIGVIF
ncbi:DUF3667 domain-containing protein [Hyphobacterium sp. HN65]|uniref:DUF3667 domain-containing protein n=1 Tax=Hyphobacterium lacteum TaxID=3116575 RepID=A0ABU7LSH5_9PROT|nr:DUF3667 domain-containing protein [Hyphobacterium sp. HN65]MEE2526289.1 DUF3667 domain-containing protein [Hyphobacterium sp. HN65]